MARRPPPNLLTICLLILIIFYLLAFHRRSDSNLSPKSHLNFQAVRNETLGFSKIFIVSLPDRSDKRDAVSLAASVTGLKYDWVNGVDGGLIPKKAIPQGWPEEETNKTLGCWRAHMNAVQRIVKEQIPSALIMEDDADWDVTLKSQLIEFARGTRFLQDASNKQTDSPYGDDWDLLWLGHCGTRNREKENQKYYVIRDDPTVVPQHLRGYPRRQPNLTPSQLSGNHTRVIYAPVRGLCTFGYALSLKGAQKLLYHQSMTGHAAVSDRALQGICNDRFMGFSCLAPYPALIGTHKAAGMTSKDSDREDTTKSNGGFRDVGVTGQIVYSTRLNLGQLMGGQKFVKSQWPQDTRLPEIDPSIDLPRGRGFFVTADQYKDFERPN